MNIALTITLIVCLTGAMLANRALCKETIGYDEYAGWNIILWTILAIVTVLSIVYSILHTH